MESRGREICYVETKNRVTNCTESEIWWCLTFRSYIEGASPCKRRCWFGLAEGRLNEISLF
ncbi:MAG: hypothetical protein ACTS4U_00365 [Candidatus Hodgkinia cicadicola]